MSNLSKTLLAAIVVVMTLLFVVTTFVPYAPARTEAQAYFTADEIDIGLEYTFQRRLFYWAGVLIELGFLSTLTLTSLGRRLADRCLAWTAQNRLFAALLFGLIYWAIDQLLYLPISVARLQHSREWGMYNGSDGDWLHDKSISMAIDLVTRGIAGGGLYLLLILLPRSWWLLAPVVGGVLTVNYVLIAPILIDPLYNDFTPIEQTEWRHLQPRMRALIAKAGVDVEQILVSDASRQSNHTNAYFTGFGATRRIVLYDTLLKNHTPEEIESVLAHELGHWMHDHIVKGLLLGTLAAIVACLVLDQILRFAGGRSPWNLTSTADPAGVPLVMLAVFLGTWAIAPLQNGVSRYMEREADYASLELAGKPHVFIATEQKMARVNLSNVAPTPWNVWLFSSHPTTVERIRMAEEWRP